MSYVVRASLPLEKESRMTVVVCTPGGDHGNELVEAGIEQARATGAALVLLQHVRVDDSDLAQQVGRGGGGIAAAREALSALAARITSDHGVSCRARVLTSGTDNPSGELLEAAREEDVSLFVLGVRSRSRVGKLLLGSTTQDLLLGSGRRVLCVPVGPERR
jgi:nucleotide-binding universal stress UspA family protein